MAPSDLTILGLPNKCAVDSSGSPPPFDQFDNMVTTLSTTLGINKTDLLNAIAVFFFDRGPDQIAPLWGFPAQSNTDMFSQDLQPLLPNGIYRIFVQPATAAKLSVIVKKPNGDSKTIKANGNVALPAGAGFSVDIPIYNKWKYNFQFDTTITVDLFQIMELTP